MLYKELIEVMHQYRDGNLTKRQMSMAIGLWQRKEYGTVAV